MRQLLPHPDPLVRLAALPDGRSLVSLHVDAAKLEKFTVVLWNLPKNARRELAIDGKNLVGYGEIMGQEPVLFTADSDSSLTAWEIMQSF